MDHCQTLFVLVESKLCLLSDSEGEDYTACYRVEPLLPLLQPQKHSDIRIRKIPQTTVTPNNPMIEYHPGNISFYFDLNSITMFVRRKFFTHEICFQCVRA